MKKTLIALMALAGITYAADTVNIDFGRYDAQTDGYYNIHTAQNFTMSNDRANYVNDGTSEETTHNLTLGSQSVTLTFRHYQGDWYCGGLGLIPTLTPDEENGWKNALSGTLPGSIVGNVSDGLTSQNGAGTGFYTLTFSGLQAGVYSIIGMGGYNGNDTMSSITVSLGSNATANWSSQSATSNGWTTNATATSSNSINFANSAGGGNHGYYFDAQNIVVGEEGTITLTIQGTGNAGYGRTPLNFISLSGEAIPEPTTATLSLLALAGLAARRRRK